MNSVISLSRGLKSNLFLGIFDEVIGALVRNGYSSG